MSKCKRQLKQATSFLYYFPSIPNLMKFPLLSDLLCFLSKNPYNCHHFILNTHYTHICTLIHTHRFKATHKLKLLSFQDPKTSRMSSSVINHDPFTMEAISIDSVSVLFGVVIIVLEFVFHSFLYIALRKPNVVEKTETLVKSEQKQATELVANKNAEDVSLCREEVEMVMERLGTLCTPQGDKLQGRLGLDDISKLFEEYEPSFDEVKCAFDVFDKNRDGFIDEIELNRVLCSLGVLKNGTEVDDCKRMINVFDQNGDGQIDFTEFVKLMENSFC